MVTKTIFKFYYNMFTYLYNTIHSLMFTAWSKNYIALNYYYNNTITNSGRVCTVCSTFCHLILKYKGGYSWCSLAPFRCLRRPHFLQWRLQNGQKKNCKFHHRTLYTCPNMTVMKDYNIICACLCSLVKTCFTLFCNGCNVFVSNSWFCKYHILVYIIISIFQKRIG